MNPGSTGSLEQSDAAAAAVQKTSHRVTLDSIKDKVSEVIYVRPHIATEVTICIMKLSNGFVVVGKSAPADPANFDAALGEKFAFEDCIRQVWPLEGYRLRSQLAGHET